MSEVSLHFAGVLEGHTDWVTSIRTHTVENELGSVTTKVFSSSRDRKVIVWNCGPQASNDMLAGRAVRALSGHSQAVQDLGISANGKYAISASWDKTLRLWDLESGTSLRTFIGHTSDVNSVALSPDNRQIVSGSRDKTIRLWNTMAECKFTIEENKHSDWVSCVRFSPASSERETLIVSCGWDKLVKVWDLQNCQLKHNLSGHTGALHSVTISPDGSLCASGGKDGKANLWDVTEAKSLFVLEAGAPINTLTFSPCDYWICAATDDSVKVWDLEDKKLIANVQVPAAYAKTRSERKGPSKGAEVPWCTSVAWTADGQRLFAGSSDGRIYVYDICQ